MSTPASATTPQHTIWTHWVDSQHPLGTEVQDEGDMYPQDNGETLEYGAMVNPESGKVEKYEECWFDVNLDELKGEGRRFGWVLKSESEGWRGMVVRIGDYVQGVAKKGEKVGAERWEWKGGKWVSVVSVGDLDIPLGGVFKEEGGFEVGRLVTGKATSESNEDEERVWKVVEAFQW